MNKSQFLTELKENLCGLPDNDIQSSLDYYSEIIDDHIEDGFTEEEAIKEIGDLQEISKSILSSTPIIKLVKQRIIAKRQMSILETVLLILGSPIWLSLLVVAFAAILSAYIAVWSLIISLWSIFASLVACVLCIVAGIVICISGNVFSGLVIIAAGVVSVGLAILIFYGCTASTKGMMLFSKKIIFWIKSGLLRKEKA